MSQLPLQLLNMSKDDWVTRALFLGKCSLYVFPSSQTTSGYSRSGYPGVSHSPAFSSVPAPQRHVRFLEHSENNKVRYGLNRDLRKEPTFYTGFIRIIRIEPTKNLLFAIFTSHAESVAFMFLAKFHQVHCIIMFIHGINVGEFH